MQPPSYSNSAPVNGVLILILGILSILGIPILGPVAWIMGNNALALIDSGAGDPMQRQNTVIGRVCGIVGTVFLILGVLGFIAYIAFFATLFKTALNHPGASISPAVGTVKKPHGHGRSLPGYFDLSRALTAGDAEKIKAIVHKNPAVLDMRNAQGQTLLFQTVTDGKPAMTGLLLRLGAPVNAKDNTGATALDKAHELNKDDILAVLAGHGGKSGKS